RGGQAGEEVADGVEDARVGGGIAAGCAADGRLVDHDHLVEQFLPADFPVRAGPFLRAEPVPEQRAAQDVIDERALARAAHAGDAGESADGDARVDVLEVVCGRAANLQPAFFWFDAFL